MGGPNPSARAAACAAGSYNWGKLGIYSFHQRFGLTEPARLRNFQLGGYRLVGWFLFCFDVTEKLWGCCRELSCRLGWLVSEMLSPLQQKGKHGHPFQMHTRAQPKHPLVVHPPQGPEAFHSPRSGIAAAQLLWHYLCTILVTA